MTTTEPDIVELGIEDQVEVPPHIMEEVVNWFNDLPVDVHFAESFLARQVSLSGNPESYHTQPPTEQARNMILAVLGNSPRLRQNVADYLWKKLSPQEKNQQIEKFRRGVTEGVSMWMLRPIIVVESYVSVFRDLLGIAVNPNHPLSHEALGVVRDPARESQSLPGESSLYRRAIAALLVDRNLRERALPALDVDQAQVHFLTIEAAGDYEPESVMRLRVVTPCEEKGGEKIARLIQSQRDFLGVKEEDLVELFTDDGVSLGTFKVKKGLKDLIEVPGAFSASGIEQGTSVLARLAPAVSAKS